MWINAKIIGANQKRGNATQTKRGDIEFVMSRSELVPFAECPAKWLAGEKVEEESKAMVFGSVLDCLATTPEVMESKFVVAPETYPPDNKPWTYQAKYCKQWRDEQEAKGFTVVSAEMMEDAKKAHKELHQFGVISSLIECSEKQVLIVADWKDEATGLVIPFAALLDLVPDVSNPTWGKALADIKTCRNGNPANWARVCDDSGYDVQAAIYFDLYRSARPDEDRTDFIHIVQENTFPFHVVTPPPCLSTEFLEWGRAKYKRAMRMYCQCLASNVWPSYEQVGIPFGNTQIIAPDQLWNYRQMVGFKEFVMPEEKPQPSTKNNDLIP